jgi:hypothetical protein
LEPRAREEMSSVDTDESLEFIRDFFTSWERFYCYQWWAQG